MGVMATFARKTLVSNRVRTIVTIIGIALAAALITAVLTTFNSLQATLYRSSATNMGTWMAAVTSEDVETLDAQIADALDDGAISNLATVEELGFGELTNIQQKTYGTYLPLCNISGDAETTCAIRPTSGRLPETPDEIMLFDTWRTGQGGFALGDSFTIDVGKRRAIDVSKNHFASEHIYDAQGLPVSSENADDTPGYSIVDGSNLPLAVGYLDATKDKGPFNEELIEKQTRTFTVVGFYNRTSSITSTSVGVVAFTCDAPGAFAQSAYFTVENGGNSIESIRSTVEDLFPDQMIRMHSDLLYYMGMSSTRSIYSTFFNIVLILITVIAIACISLIYNAFAISIAERVKQFGLIASVGASKNQLMRAVVIEALIVAIIGIPLGILIGIGGCAVTFAALGDSLKMLIDSTTPFELAIDPVLLAVAAAITLATVLLSALIPAFRASKINIIDALRGTTDGRTSKRGAARARKAAEPNHLWRGSGLAGAVFGIGGKLARINEKRGATKARAASISLALAIVLLMTAGSLSTFLGRLVDAASADGTVGDIAVYASFATPGNLAADQDKEGEQGQDGMDGAALGEGKGTTLAQEIGAANARFAKQADLYRQAYESLCTVPDTDPIGWRMNRSQVPVIMDADLAGDVLSDPNAAITLDGGPTTDGSVLANALITYLDDAYFDTYVANMGLTPAEYHDVEHPRAIGVAKGYGNNGQRYQLLEMMKQTGTVEVIQGGLCKGKPVTDLVASQDVDDNGQVFYRLISPLSGEQDKTDDIPFYAPITDTSGFNLDVAVLVDTTPEVAGANPGNLQFIMPVSQARFYGFGMYDPSFLAAFDATTDSTATVSANLIATAEEFFESQTDFEVGYVEMHDFAADMNTNRMLATAVNVFCLLFTVILALIALANVFNTVTNGLILRRREFAIMKSVGMSASQFRSMIMDECATWCLRGLIPGVILSVGVSFMLYTAVSESLEGLMFTLPWSYVVLAAVMILLTIALSVAYGMHRCNADNIVEAIRMDAI